MKFIKLYEDFNSDDKIEEIEDYFLELLDHNNSNPPISVEVEDHIVSKTWDDKSKKVGIKGYKISVKYDFYDQLFVKRIVDNTIIRLSNEYTIHFSRISKQGNGYNRKELPVNGTDRTVFVSDPIWKWIITISPKKIMESNINSSTLLIVDVQKSFSKFFTKKYLSELNKYCKNFTDVYQVFDNHHDGKNPDKDYLYDDDPDIENKSDLYTFPNQVDVIEKRYQYDVDADFYKKILSEKVYKEMKLKDDNKQLKRGDYFITTENTIIVYIGNNHRYFHVPKKLYDLFMKFKEAQSEGLKEVTIVGGSSGECIFDIIVSAKALGLNIVKDDKFIYSASFCPL
jgi:hypothetical protein